MILTGKAVEYAESFEELDRKMLEKVPNYKLPEMTEDDQIHLVTIMMMYERDEAFKNFMKGCCCLFAEKRMESLEALLEMFLKMRQL